MGLKQSFTAFWDRVTGKSLYEISQSVNTLEERLNMMQLDLDAANIKLASKLTKFKINIKTMAQVQEEGNQ